MAEEYELSRRDYEVMSRLCIGAENKLETMEEWMKCDMTGDSDYPTTWDCFSADHPETLETGKDVKNNLPTFVDLAKHALKNKGPKEKNITIKIEALTAKMMIEQDV